MPLQMLYQHLQKTIKKASPLIRKKGLEINDDDLSFDICDEGKHANVTGYVTGTRSYEVLLCLYKNEEFCECRYFNTHFQVCKHMVAMAHAALRCIENDLTCLQPATRVSIRYAFHVHGSCHLTHWSLVPYINGVASTFAKIRLSSEIQLDTLDQVILNQVSPLIPIHSDYVEQPRYLDVVLLLLQNQGRLIHPLTGESLAIHMQPREPILSLRPKSEGGAVLVPILKANGEIQEMASDAQLFGSQVYVLQDSSGIYLLNTQKWPIEKLHLLCQRHDMSPEELVQNLPLFQRMPDVVEISEEIKPPSILGSAAPVLQLILQEDPCELCVRLRFRYEGLTELQIPGEGRPVLTTDLKGDLYYVQRNAMQELHFLEVLRNHMRNNSWIYSLNRDQLRINSKSIPLFIDNVIEQLRHNPAWTLEGMAELNRYQLRKPRITLQVSSGIDWFDLSGCVDYDGQQLPLQILLDIPYDSTEMTLPDGSRGWVPVKLRKLLRIARGLQENAKDSLRVSKLHLGILDSLLEDKSLIVSQRKALQKKIQSKALRPIPVKPVPSELCATLRSYQEEGLHWIRQMREWGTGGILADDMGLGKTVQVIAALCDFYAQTGEVRPSIVVMPTSLVHNWKHELQRFAPHLPVMVHHGLGRPSLDASTVPLGAIILTSYSLLRNEIHIWKTFQFGYAILDESQAIKNPISQSLSCARQLQCAHRLALTGTPIENNLMDLWSQFNFVIPGLLGGRDFFQREFAKSVAQDAPEAAQQLSRLIAPFYLRRTKEKVLKDLPPLDERVLYVEMNEAQRQLYDRTKKVYRKKILEDIKTYGIRKSQMRILEGMLRLRQIACDPRLYQKNARASSAKLDYLVNKLKVDIIQSHKALVFSQFTSLLELCEQSLKAANIDYAYLDGSTRDRAKAIEEFTNHSDKRVFLISLKAGGAGLNLTAADYVFHLDPWWNPAVEAQATGRAHRIGQKQVVQSIKIVAEGTIEEKILKLQDRKRQLAAQVICSDQGLIQSLDLDMVTDFFK